MIRLQKWLEGFANATVKTANDAAKTDSDVAGMMR